MTKTYTTFCCAHSSSVLSWTNSQASSHTCEHSTPKPNEFTYNEIQTDSCSEGWQLTLQITDHFPSIVHFLPSPHWRFLSLFTANSDSCAMNSIWNKSPPPSLFSSLLYIYTHLFLSLSPSHLFLYLSFPPSVPAAITSGHFCEARKKPEMWGVPLNNLKVCQRRERGKEGLA